VPGREKSLKIFGDVFAVHFGDDLEEEVVAGD
jgi:hypothetical protein